MRKAFLAFGIILVFAGVIVVSASNTPEEKMPQISTIASAEHRWEVGPGRFKENEKLIVDFTPPNPEYDLIPDYPVRIVVEVTGPEGGKTVFAVEFKEGFGGKLAPPKYTVVSNNDCLTVSDSLQDVCGIVHYTGDYFANVTTRRLGTWGPPKALFLKLEVVEMEYPFLFVQPIGIALIVVGGFLSVWGAISSKRKLRLGVKKR